MSHYGTHLLQRKGQFIVGIVWLKKTNRSRRHICSNGQQMDDAIDHENDAEHQHNMSSRGRDYNYNAANWNVYCCYMSRIRIFKTRTHFVIQRNLQMRIMSAELRISQKRTAFFTRPLLHNYLRLPNPHSAMIYLAQNHLLFLALPEGKKSKYS